MKIIFLDIDGVLAPIPRPFKQDQFKASCVNCFESIFESVPDAKIVISSTWRIGSNLKKLRKLLEKSGLSCADRIIGKTVDYTETGEFLYLTRGQEISTWLMDQTDIESYVIVDDDTDISPHGPRWVQPVHELGVQEDDAKRCITILQKAIKNERKLSGNCAANENLSTRNSAHYHSIGNIALAKR